MQFHRAILIGLGASSLVACNQERATTTKVERSLTVTGSREGIERFVQLQHSLRPPLTTSPIRDLPDGRAWAVVKISGEQTNEDVVHTTREALAAGLSYKFDDNRSTVTKTL